MVDRVAGFVFVGFGEGALFTGSRVGVGVGQSNRDVGEAGWEGFGGRWVAVLLMSASFWRQAQARMLGISDDNSFLCRLFFFFFFLLRMAEWNGSTRLSKRSGGKGQEARKEAISSFGWVSRSSSLAAFSPAFLSEKCKPMVTWVGTGRLAELAVVPPAFQPKEKKRRATWSDSERVAELAVLPPTFRPEEEDQRAARSELEQLAELAVLPPAFRPGDVKWRAADWLVLKDWPNGGRKLVWDSPPNVRRKVQSRRRG